MRRILIGERFEVRWHGTTLHTYTTKAEADAKRAQLEEFGGAGYSVAVVRRYRHASGHEDQDRRNGR